MPNVKKNVSAKVLNTKTDAELLSYIINVTPELKDEIDLPVQGESIKPIGQIIINNERYRNAFINTVNLIGLTVIKRNAWENPWRNFTNRGTINFGESVRELMLDLADIKDYNEEIKNVDNFLKTAVPNVFNYIHQINFQKYYETTTSDSQLAMAFDTEGGLFQFIDEAISILYTSLQYDEYLVDKYQLCRRILDGTVTPVYIENFATKTSRQVVADMKAISNKMTFMKPNYNPAGIRRATKFEDQYLILNTDFSAKFETDVLATSFFRNDAEFKTNLAMIDGFNDFDTARLIEILGKAYVEFTEDEISQLANVLGTIISREWFMDYYYSLDNATDPSVYGTRKTEFFNPTTLMNNHFLHSWRIFSTSPFENACVFTSVAPSVTSVTLTPGESSVSAGLTVQLSADVVTTGFANKAVIYTVTKGADKGVTVSDTGLVTIPSDFDTSAEQAAQVEITATSVYDKTVTGKATITVL